MELADGSKVQAAHKAPNVTLVARKTVCKVDFTITQLLFGVDLVLVVSKTCCNSLISISQATRGGQIIRNSCGPCPQRIADTLRCIADEDQRVCGVARMPKGPKRGKHVKNADNTENPWTVQEKRASTAELSPVDPTDVICSS